MAFLIYVCFTCDKAMATIGIIFIAEVAELNSVTADRILHSLKSPYIRATFEFMRFVLDELTGLNMLFQCDNTDNSDRTTISRAVKSCMNFMKLSGMNFMKLSFIRESQFNTLPIDNPSSWKLSEQINPGLEASETIKLLLPHQKEGFLIRCRDWYCEATNNCI